MNTFNNTFVFFILFLYGQLLQANEIESSILSYVDCHEYTQQLKFPVAPQECSNGTQKITFIIKGNNITEIDKDSLVLSSLTVDGKEISSKRNGKKTYELNAFHRIDDDGRYVIFEIVFDSVPFGHIHAAQFEGKINIITSEKLMIDELTIEDWSEPFSKDIGPYLVSNQPILSSVNTDDETKTKDLKKQFHNAMVKGKEDKLAIYLNGDSDVYVDLEVYQDKSQLTQDSSSWTNNSRTIFFDKPDDDKVNLKLKFWHGLRHIAVPIKSEN